MDHKTRRKLSQGLASGMKKAFTANQVNRQLMRYLSPNSPISFEDNDEAYVNQGYGGNPDVYAIVNGITKAASAVPFLVHRVVNEDKARKYYRHKSMLTGGATERQADRLINMKMEAFEEVEPDNDLYKLLERPNPLQAFPEWYENTKGFQLLTGNAYTYFNMLTDGRIGEMWVMPSQWTRIQADSGSQALIDSYIIELYGHTGSKIDAEQVMHWKYWNPNYDNPGQHLYGQSPLKAGRKSLRLGNDADDALSVSLRNGGTSGMIYPEGDNFSEITPEQQSQIRSFLDRNQGPDNFKSFLVFSAKMGYKPFGQSPVDLELIEAGKLSQRDLCNLYNYPSILLNDSENSTYSNYVQARKQLHLDLVIPTLERDYAEMNRNITPHFNDERNKYHIDYDLQAISAIQQDNKDKVEWLSKAWWLTMDEKRQEMGYEGVGDDNLYIPANLIPGDVSDLSQEELKRLKDEYER